MVLPICLSLSSSLLISSSSSAWSWTMSSAPALAMLSVCQFLTLPSQSASGLVFHSSLSRAPSSLLTVAHSGLTAVLDSLGGSCCFLGFLRGLGSRLGGGCCAGGSSPDSPEKRHQ